MADAGEMWIELGLRDNVNDQVNELLKGFKYLDNQVANVVKTLHGLHDFASEDELGWTKDAISQAKEYYNLVAKISQAERDLNTVLKERSSRKMNDGKELEYWEKLMKLRDQLKGGIPLDDKDFVNAFKLSLENTVREVKDQVATAKGEMKKFDEAEMKKAEVRRAITAETERLAAAEERIQRMRDDASSKATIASIKDQTVEYDAQMQKVRELDALLKKVEKDRLAALRGSGMPHSTMTESAINKEVDAIQRRYNEDVATGNKLAQDAANAKKQQEEAQNKLNATLRESERLENAVAKARMDAESQARISRIQQKTADYNAAIIKARELEDLERKIAADRAVVSSGGTATYTKERVLAELDAIQRRYNEALYVGREYERQDAEAKKQAADASRRLAEANKSLMTSYDKVTQSGRQTMNTLSMLRQQAGYYFSLFGAQTLLRNVITIGGQFEFQHVALQNIIGDAEKATAIFAQLKDLAVESPKTFMELTASAKQLSAYQIPDNELFDTTKRLSDLSVGLGVDINRLILAYGQVRSAAVLRGQELRQFTEAGIPMVQALAQKFTELNGKVTTTADVFKLISQRAVSFEMVKEVLWDMTNQGGQFFNMQSTMADTLYGKWQKLQDIWQITLGDIADANSLSGQFFKVALDGVIFLARNLQALVPLIGVFGLYKGTRSINSWFGGMGAIDSNIAKAQKLNEITLRRRRLVGEITEKEYQDGIALNRKKSSYYEILAMEGKISDRKIAQLAIDGKMNKMLAYRLLLMEGYSKEQIKAAMADNGRGLAGNFSARNFGSKALSFMGGWTGMAFEAAGIAASIYQAYNSWSAKIEERVNSTVTKAKEATRGISEAFSDFDKYGQPKDVEEMRERVERMKQILVNSDMYTDTVRQQVESAGSLNEQYNTLLKTLKEAKGQADYIISNKNNLAEAIKATSSSFDFGKIAAGYATGGLAGVLAEADSQLFEWMFNDDITKNLEQYREALSNIESQMHAISAYENEYTSVIAQMSKSYSDFATLVEGKSPEEAIKAIAESAYWEEFANKVDKSDTGFRKLVSKLIDYSDTANGHLQEIVDDDIDKMLGKLAEQRGMELGEYKKWLNEHPIQARRVVNEIIEVMNLGGRALIGFTNKLRAAIGLDPISFKEQAADLQKKAYQDQTQAGKNVLGTLMKGARKNGWGDKYGNGVWDVKWINKFFEGGTGYQDGLKSMRTAWANLKEEREAAAKAGGKLSAVEEAEFQRLDKAASVFDFKEKKSKIFGNTKKGSGGSKTDEVAKAAKERVSVLKDAYSEYKKWSDLVGKEGALAKVKESGLFGSLFADKDFKGLDDYKGELKRIKSKLSPSKTEQRGVIEDIDKILLGMSEDEMKEQAEKAVELLRSSMEKIGRQWDLYKSLYEKTGNRDFANLAFSGGVLWDEKATAMAEELSKKANLGTIDFTMSEESAKEFFKYNTVEGKGLYELWKQITDLIRNNYDKGLEDSAAAMAELKTEEEKIADIEQKIADLRKQGAADNDPRIIKARKDIATLQQQAFEKTGGYLKFYNAILSMTIPEAEKVGQEIRENLDKNMQKGVISAKEYVRQVKLINEQMQKLRGKQGDFSALMSGGLQGLFQNKYDKAESDFNQSVIDLQNASKMYEKAISNGSRASFEQAQSAMDSAGAMKEGAAAAMNGASSAMSTVAMIDKIVHGINDIVQGIKGTFDEIREMYDALGHDTQSDSWEDWNTFFDGFSKASQNATNAWDSLKNGNAGGVVQGVVGSFTSWVTAFSQGHDRKLDHQIQLAQEQINAIDRLRDSLETQLERTLGGVYAYTSTDRTKSELSEWYRVMKGDNDLAEKYNFRQRNGKDTINALGLALNSGEYYEEQLALLLKNRDELQKQLRSEQDKKKSDGEKIADYKQSIEEIKDQIQHFAEDMAKALYDIDIKSWARELTDAVVDAWVSGEDAAQAWHDKVTDLVKDVTKNILAQKVVEMALQPVLDYITNEMTQKSGKLDENSIMGLADVLGAAGDVAVNGVTSLLEAMKAAGYDLSDAGKGSSSASQVLSGLSENDQNLLLSYVNAIRGDVSVLRTLAEQEAGTLTGMNATVQLQLRELEAISANTRRSADSAEFIETFCRGLRDGEYTLKVK